MDFKSYITSIPPEYFSLSNSVGNNQTEQAKFALGSIFMRGGFPYIFIFLILNYKMTIHQESTGEFIIKTRILNQNIFQDFKLYINLILQVKTYT